MSCYPRGADTRRRWQPRPPAEEPVFAIVETTGFPIDEDDLLAVTERLVYLGRQKDVAEVRRWLRQFDDESRIEVAFLLLKRLAEKGFVTQGANVNGLANMVDSLNARRREVGDGGMAHRAAQVGQPLSRPRRLGHQERRGDGAGTGEADEPRQVRLDRRDADMGARPSGRRSDARSGGRFRRNRQDAGEGLGPAVVAGCGVVLGTGGGRARGVLPANGVSGGRQACEAEVSPKCRSWR